MARRKISELESATDVTANDLIQIVDVEDDGMAITGTNKKTTANLLARELAKQPLEPGVVISGSSSSEAVRITQTGTGNPLVVDDNNNPDPTSDSTQGSLFLRNIGGVAGDGAFSTGIAFSGINSTRRRAFIGAIQDTADGDQFGLQFFTRSSITTGNSQLNSTPALYLTYSNGVVINRTSVTSPVDADGNVFSGTYTPTLTNTSNISSSTSFSAQYMRVGDVVTVSGAVSVDPVATNNTQLNISLPIASNIDSAQNLGGTGADNTLTQFSRMYGDSTNNNAILQFIASDLTSRTHSFSFTYRII